MRFLLFFVSLLGPIKIYCINIDSLFYLNFNQFKNGYIEYYHTSKSFSKTKIYKNNISIFYDETNSYKSLKKVVLKIDSSFTYVVHNNKFYKFYHKNATKTIESIDSFQVYLQLQHLISLPHLTNGYVIKKYLDTLHVNYKFRKEKTNLHFEINGKYHDDTDFVKSAIISGEFNENFCLNEFQIQFINNFGDTDLTIFKYKDCFKKLKINEIDSVVFSIISKYEKYELIQYNPHRTNVDNVLNFKIDSLKFVDSNIPILKDSIKLYLIDFWYSSCIPCVKAIPFLNLLNQKYLRNGFKVVGLNYYDSKEKSLMFSKKYKINYNVALKNENNFLNNLKISIFPTFWLINSNGELLYKHEGYSKNSEVEIENIIKEFLNLR